jgi:ribosomal protein L17
VVHGRIETTLPRAKEIRPLVEKLVTIARNGGTDIATIRLITATMGGQRDVAKALISEYAPKYADRKGGYTRIVKLPNRLSDGSEMAEQVQKAEHQTASKNLEHLKKRLRDFGISEVETDILEGYPGDEIVKLAKKTKVDLIIMSTHGRSGLGRVLMGSVTDQVIHQADCPVLVVRPKIKKQKNQ